LPSKVNVNDLTVVHATSDGIAPSFPDVCLTPAPPAPPIPIPYPNVAKSSDASNGTKTVKIEGNPVMIQDATFATSTGDEAGSAGGVASATTKGKAKFVNYSFDVKFEGKCVPRLGDPMTHNELSSPNTPPFPEVQPPHPMVPSPIPGDPPPNQLVALGIQNRPAKGPKPAAAPKTPAAYEMVWDDLEDRQQWVNLPDRPDFFGPNCGREVKLTGHVEPRVAGQEVTFELVAEPGNTIDTGTDDLAAKPALSGANGSVTARLALPIFGGQAFRISAKTASMASAAISGRIVVWRRFFYQVSVMDPAPDGTRFDPPKDLVSSLKDTLAKVFIDLQPSTTSSATTPFIENLGTSKEQDAIKNQLAAASKDGHSPFKLNILTINAADTLDIQEDIASWKTSIIETKPFRKWIHDPTIIRADYESSPGDWKPLQDVQVQDQMDDHAIISAMIPERVPRKGFRVWLRYRYQKTRSAAGWGGPGGTLFICMGTIRRNHSDNEISPTLRRVMSHEIGHALGLVPPTASWRDTNPRDDVYPKTKHCAHRTADHFAACVMWWRIKGSGNPKFYCTAGDTENCSHFLRAADLAKVEWI
jgi:hypothetical protein